MEDAPQTLIGLRAPAPPTLRRSDPWGWLCASAFAGGVAGLAALALAWRPLPLFSHVPWELADELGCLARGAAHLASDRLFAQGAKACVEARAALPPGARLGVGAREAIALAAACAPAWLLFAGFMRPRDGLIHLRGATRVEGPAAVKALRAKFGAQAAREPDHEICPGVPYPSTQWARHVLLAGGTGAGKSTFLRPLLRSIVEADERAIIFDPKGEFTAAFAAPILIAPWDARSWAWDIGRDMRNSADMRRFAESIIPASGSDPMWSSASRQVLVGLMVWLRATRGSDWGFEELADAVAMPQPSIAEIMRKHWEQGARLVDRPNVTSNGILINLAAACAPIHDLALAWADVPPERRVSFVDWTLGDRGPRQIILQGHGSYPQLTQAFAGPIVETVASLVSSAEMADGPAPKRWLVCDELPALGRVKLRVLYEQGRSRNFRVVVAYQDAAQLEEIHGDKLVRSMASMVGTLIVGRTGPGDTAEQLAKAAGMREVERPNLSSSYAGSGAANPSTTLSYARDQMPVYLASELGSRLGTTPDGDGVAMALMVEGRAYELRWPFVSLGQARPQCVLAPWTYGGTGEAGSGLIAAGSAARKPAEPGQPPELGKGEPAMDREWPGADGVEVVAAPEAAPPSLGGAEASALSEAVGHEIAPSEALGAASLIALAADAVADPRRGPVQEARVAKASPKDRDDPAR